MGFPVSYPEVTLPKLLIHILPLLTFITSLSNSLISFFHHLNTYFSPSSTTPEFHLHRPTLSATLIREFLPVITFRHLARDFPVMGCAVCLNEFAGDEEIRCIENCKHIFHRTCVDRWIDLDQTTCPLCRTELLPYQKIEDYNQRLIDASQFEDNNASLFSQRHDDSYF